MLAGEKSPGRFVMAEMLAQWCAQIKAKFLTKGTLKARPRLVDCNNAAGVPSLETHSNDKGPAQRRFLPLPPGMRGERHCAGPLSEQLSKVPPQSLAGEIPA